MVLQIWSHQTILTTHLLLQPKKTKTVLNVQVLESTVDACKVVEACLTCTDLRFQMVVVMLVIIIMLLVMDHQVRVVQAGLTWWW